MKRLLFTFAFALAAFAQTPVRDIPYGCPSGGACKTILAYSGTSLIYQGSAPMFLNSPNTWLKRTTSTLTSIAVLTNVATVTCATACGVWEGQRVTVAGASVDTDLNGSYTVTSDTDPTATTFTFATASVGNATYTESTLTITTSNPLTFQTLWTVAALKYDGSSNLTEVNTWTNIAWSARTTY